MASVLKRRLKGKATALYAKLKRGEQWTQAATSQATRALAFAWATVRCECVACVRARNGAPALPLDALPEAPAAPPKPRMGALLDTWIETLTNASAADDRSRMKKHVRPTFAEMAPDEVNLAVVMQWIDKLRTTPASTEKRPRRKNAEAGKLADSTVRHTLNLLSRFFSWAVTRGHASLNPVRLIPQGERPRSAPKRSDVPWIADDKVVRDLMNALAPPFREMFYLGNRAGLRPCETRGLRMSDLAHISEGYIRARYSDDRPYLKEDKQRQGKAKWVPCPTDFDVVMGPLLARRQAAEPQPEDLVFTPELTRGALKQRMEAAWLEAADSLGLELKQYEATRHSMISRNLDAGVPVDEVSRAVGHTTPATTLRHYDHLVRPRYASALLRAGLGTVANETDAAIVPFRKPA